MTWCIAADSSCNIRTFTPESEATYRLAPLKINVGGAEYTDDEHLDIRALLDAMALEDQASSSACPSVGEWAEIFRTADNIIAICISSNVSGSYDAACTARNLVMEEYMRENGGIITGKNIQVVDSRAAGGKLEVMVRLLDRYLTTKDATFEGAVAYVENLVQSSQVQYSLSSYDNLMKNGRMPRLVGTVATKLSIRILGTASSEGTIKIVGPTRGEKKMFKKIMDVMEGDGYRGGMVYIDHVDNESGAMTLRTAIETRWPTAEVFVIPCGGLCSYYAEESGLIIGYEWA